MTQDFYDKVAKKFGNYHTAARIVYEFPNGEPEKIFKEKLLKASGKNKVVLDVGCADGRFTLSIAPNFKKIIAIDTSKGMLKAAERNKKAAKVKNVDFVYQDVHKINFPKDFFDVIYDRRGPDDYPLFYEQLKPGGFFLQVDIGEKDTKDLKMVFGRGQNYGKWDISELKKDIREIKKLGFEIVYAKDFSYNEYYLSFEDLDRFLQGVPIFEDYDSERDRKFLEAYVKKFQKERGINLLRHRVVLIAKKV
ncbi:MAG: methyltransferase domain-containing protein [Patescibacteria group bacterium]|nr:methyltransferase domain-containing protein [Patescibacteria group bacterium]